MHCECNFFKLAFFYIFAAQGLLYQEQIHGGRDAQLLITCLCQTEKSHRGLDFFYAKLGFIFKETKAYIVC